MQTTITAEFRVNGALTTADTVVLRDAGATYGVKRLDTDAVVVAAGTAMSEVSTGLYAYSFEDPASGLEYEYVVEVTYNGVTTRETGQKLGGTSGLGDLYDLLDRVLPYVGGCPYEVARQKLRDAFQEFCEQTGIWREDLAVIDTEEDEDTYDLTHGYDATVMRVLSVKQDDTYPWAYTPSLDRTQFVLTSTPSEDGLEMTVRVVFRPKDNCTAAPQWLLDQWGRYIAAGAVDFIKRVTKTPYSDAQGAQEYGALYRQGQAQARWEVIHEGRAPRDVRMQSNVFFC